MWTIALIAGGGGFAVKHAIHGGPRLTALAVLPIYGGIYLALAYWMGVPELIRIAHAARTRLFPQRR